MKNSGKAGAALGAAAVLTVALAGCGHATPAPGARKTAPAAARASQPAPAPAPDYPTITAIKAMGTRRYTSAQVARASGLRVGEKFSSAAVRAAEERLAASGAFTEVNSLLVPSDNGQIVDLELSDNPHFFPVSFAGFDGWSAARLRAYLRRQVPLFTGEVPLLRLGVVHQVREALDRLAASQGWPGRVRMEIGLTGGGNAVAFRLGR